MEITDIKAKYPLGSEPDITYLAYLIFISYVVSLIGAFTTVELLHRRLTGSGWRNLVQLSACSVSFGLVAIWCMHFVGNRAIVLGDGEDEIQLYYNPTFTAVSAILPIVVIFMGLTVADHFHRGSKRSATRYFALLVCGVCSGAAITEMHYLGNNGITNYHLQPSWRYIIGAATISIGACSIAYTLFFHWSVHWMNTWWRRFIVACFLAGAVSGMHWTATAGTLYQLRAYHEGTTASRNVNMIIAICLCLAACGVCFALGFMKQRIQRKLKDRAQQVVLAIATFDEEGRLLVTQSGLMPCQTITREFHQRTFDEDFNTSHPVFQWLYRVSRNFSGIVDLLPTMRDHLQSTGYLQTHSPVTGSTSRTSFELGEDHNYSATFRELFCVTAADIARSMDTRLQDLGQLYEDVLTTGTLLSTLRPFRREADGSKIVAADVAASKGDIEAGLINPILFGKGQLLVLTRRVGLEESRRFQNAGYRFATLDQVGEVLARSLQIPRNELNLVISRLQQFCDRKPWVPVSGTYLAAFMVQPSPGPKGLDLIVPKQTPDRLPVVQLDPEDLKPWQIKLLKAYDGLTMDECITRIAQRHGAHTEEEFVWLALFGSKIEELSKEAPEPALKRAIFSFQQLRVSHGSVGQAGESRATVFGFCGIKEIYHQSLQSKTLGYTPLSFFQCQQRIYPGCPDHAILARNNHAEFSALLTTSTVESHPLPPRPRSRWNGFWPFGRSSAASQASVQPDSSSEKGLFNVSHYASTESANQGGFPFGSIMVHQEVTVNEGQKVSSQMEMSDLGVKSEIGIAAKEEQTMADKLMAITTSLNTPHMRNLREPVRR